MMVPDADALLLFLPAMARVSGMFLVGPFWNHVNVPRVVKNGVIALIVIAVWPTISAQPLPAVTGIWSLLMLLLPEFVIGSLIGFVARIVFVAAEYAGQMVGLSVGLTMMNLLDPVSNAQVSIASRLFGMIALTLFFVTNLHHMLLGVLIRTFEAIPVGSFDLGSLPLAHIATLAAQVFILGVGIAAPIVAIMLLTELAMGFIVRTVPQMNIFIVAFPLKIGLGFTLIVFTLPYVLRLLLTAFGSVPEGVAKALGGM